MPEQKQYRALFNKISAPLTRAGVAAYEELSRNPGAAHAYFNNHARRGAGIVEELVAWGHAGLAARALAAGRNTADTLKRLKHMTRLAMLTQPELVLALARAGQARDAVEMIWRYNCEERTDILKVPHALWGLASHGQAPEAARLVKSLYVPQRGEILLVEDAVPALVLNGQVHAAVKQLKLVEPEVREKILENAHALSVLQQAGMEGEIRLMREKRPASPRPPSPGP